MKSSFFRPDLICSLVGLCLTLGAGRANAQNFPPWLKADGSVDHRKLMELTKQPTARDRITDEELEAIKKQHEIKYGPGFTPTPEAELPPRGDLYAGSALISDGTDHTLLPKHAVISVPDELKAHVIERPIGRLVLWPDFLKKNGSWLAAQEVSYETSTGDAPLSEDARKAMEKSGKIVVAVMDGNPIGVMPPKSPDLDSLTQATGKGDKRTGAPKGAASPKGTAVPLVAENSKPDNEFTPEPQAAALTEAPEAAVPATAAKRSRFDTSNRINLRRNGK